MDGHWDEARTAMARAIRYDTEDARLQFHAGMIALHFGDRTEARNRLERALALNPQFHPAYSDQARAVLATLR
jgi:Flp pilus assembly protein TadD